MAKGGRCDIDSKSRKVCEMQEARTVLAIIRPRTRTAYHWRATCSESCLRGSEGDGWKRASNGTSPAVYPTARMCASAQPLARHAGGRLGPRVQKYLL